LVDSTLEYIKKTFGSWSSHTTTFIGELVWSLVNKAKSFEKRRAHSDSTYRISVLASLVDQLETDVALEEPQVASSVSAGRDLGSTYMPR